MNRRAFIGWLAPLATLRATLAREAGPTPPRIGLCTFSCHQLWKAVQSGSPAAPFRDALGFYRHARTLGAEGVQTALGRTDPGLARRVRDAVEADGGYFEGEVSLPRDASGVAVFEEDVRRVREAGATVARAVLLGGRRYEVFRSLDDWRRFREDAERRLALAEPVLRRHQLRLAIENHKDFTTDELRALMERRGGEWIGVLVDTGNNLALLEEPHEVVEALAPYVFSVHFKDMAVQTADDGFRLSEVPPGTGALDLPRLARTLVRARPGVVFNLEMATRDPLRVPCREEAFFATFPERRAARMEKMLAWVRSHPPRRPPPSVAGRTPVEVLADEASNNRDGLEWMRHHLRA